MEPVFEQQYLRIEECHWWCLARRSLICKLVKKFSPSTDSEILEVGCSGGLLIGELNRMGFTNVVGIDSSLVAIKQCHERRIMTARRMRGEATSFTDGQFDLIIASDVLEHIGDDLSALKEWYRLLKPKGHLIVFVPAFPFLWSSHDEINHHCRRYTPRQLKCLLMLGGFSLRQASFWNFSLFFPVAIFRLTSGIFRNKFKANAQGDLKPANLFLNKILFYLLNLENQVLAADYRLPLGVSLMTIACRPPINH